MRDHPADRADRIDRADCADRAEHGVLPYGTNASAGTYRCIDCDFPWRHDASSVLPPCPRYDDGTHPRSGWVGPKAPADVPEAPREG